MESTSATRIATAIAEAKKRIAPSTEIADIREIGYYNDEVRVVEISLRDGNGKYCGLLRVYFDSRTNSRITLVESFPQAWAK